MKKTIIVPHASASPRLQLLRVAEWLENDVPREALLFGQAVVTGLQIECHDEEAEMEAFDYALMTPDGKVHDARGEHWESEASWRFDQQAYYEEYWRQKKLEGKIE